MEEQVTQASPASEPARNEPKRSLFTGPLALIVASLALVLALCALALTLGNDEDDTRPSDGASETRGGGNEQGFRIGEPNGGHRGFPPGQEKKRDFPNAPK